MAERAYHSSLPRPGLKLVPFEPTFNSSLHFVYGGAIKHDGGGTWSIAIDDNTGMPVLRRTHAANLGDEPRKEYFRVEKS